MLDSVLVQQQLRDLIAKHGAAVVGDRVRCRGLIKDYCTSDKQAANLVLAALEDGVPDDLVGSPAAALDMRHASLCRRLETDHGMTPEAAASAVAIWSFALGLREQSSKLDDAGRPQSDDAARLERNRASDAALPVRRRGIVARYGGWAVAAVLAVACVILTLVNIQSQNRASRLFDDWSDAASKVNGLQSQVDSLKNDIARKQDFPDTAFPHLVWSGVELRSPGISDKTVTKFGLTMDGQSGTATGTKTDAQGGATNFTWNARLAAVGRNLATGIDNFTVEVGPTTSTDTEQSIYIELQRDKRYRVMRLCPGSAASTPASFLCARP